MSETRGLATTADHHSARARTLPFRALLAAAVSLQPRVSPPFGTNETAKSLDRGEGG
jgi:hypothetical protein